MDMLPKSGAHLKRRPRDVRNHEDHLRGGDAGNLQTSSSKILCAFASELQGSGCFSNSRQAFHNAQPRARAQVFVSKFIRPVKAGGATPLKVQATTKSQAGS